MSGSEGAGDAGRRFDWLALEAFEGPLDLLLHLIKKRDLDVFDIPVAEVADEFARYVEVVQFLDLDGAGDYLVMAAELAQIKARMLLPKPASGSEEEEDPAASLIERLVEHRRMKEAAEQLGDRRLLGRDVFGAGQPSGQETGVPEAPIKANPFELLDAMDQVLSRMPISAEMALPRPDPITVGERMGQLRTVLLSKKKVPFAELFAGETDRLMVVITFLALLELARLRFVWLWQGREKEDVMVEATSKLERSDADQDLIESSYEQ